MDTQTKRAVQRLSAELVGHISEVSDTRDRGVYDNRSDAQIIATLEIARQLSRLTAEIGELIEINHEAMSVTRSLVRTLGGGDK